MKMKLHEALLQILEQENGILVSKAVDIINTTKVYEKKDKSDITTNQIYARVHQYPHLFYIENGRLYKK